MRLADKTNAEGIRKLHLIDLDSSRKRYKS